MQQYAADLDKEELSLDVLPHIEENELKVII
jgi:hypothetical protein